MSNLARILTLNVVSPLANNDLCLSMNFIGLPNMLGDQKSSTRTLFSTKQPLWGLFPTALPTLIPARFSNHHRRALPLLQRPPASHPPHRNQRQKLTDVQTPPDIDSHPSQPAKEPTHKHKFDHHQYPQEDIEIPPRVYLVKDDTLAYHATYTVQEPCRAEEVDYGDDDTGDVAEMEG